MTESASYDHHRLGSVNDTIFVAISLHSKNLIRLRTDLLGEKFLASTNSGIHVHRL